MGKEIERVKNLLGDVLIPHVHCIPFFLINYFITFFFFLVNNSLFQVYACVWGSGASL